MGIIPFNKQGRRKVVRCFMNYVVSFELCSHSIAYLLGVARPIAQALLCQPHERGTQRIQMLEQKSILE